MSAIRIASALVTASLIAACVDEDVGRDRDNDGFQTAELGGEDCDDTNANVNPSQSELCGNGIDDDCDGLIDNEGVGETDWYLDDDADGFTVADSVIACARPDGAQTDRSSQVDCNDDDDAIYPGAPERWYDGIDQNCDEANDFDADADGYDGVQGGGDDCDDTEVGVNPGSVELCGNGLDDDCDGTPNQCEWRGELNVEDIATAVFPVESERQWYRDLTGDGVEDVLLVTYSNRDGEREWSLYAGPFDSESVPVPLTTWTTIHAVGDNYLDHAVLEPDINGDGIPDLVVPRSRLIDFQPGIEVFLSPHQGRTQGTPDLTVPTLIAGEVTTPVAIGAMSDVDGDGADELLWSSTSGLAPDVNHSLHVTLAAQLVEGESTPVSTTATPWRSAFFPKRVAMGSSFPLIGIVPDTNQDGVVRGSDDLTSRSTVALTSQPDPVFVAMQLTSGGTLQGAIDVSRARMNTTWDIDGDDLVDSYLPAVALGRWSTRSEQFSGVAILDSAMVPVAPTQTWIAGEGTPGDALQWGSTACQWLPGGPPEIIEFGEVLERLPLVLGDAVLTIAAHPAPDEPPTLVATRRDTASASCSEGGAALFAMTSDSQTGLLFPPRP